jgi:hypothetical protein
MAPQDPRWWTDFAITTASVGTVVGWATFGCAIVATPGAQFWWHWRAVHAGQSVKLAERNSSASATNGYDIDHVVPVLCGWTFRIAPGAIASVWNLQALPSPINRSIGAKGCY